MLLRRCSLVAILAVALPLTAFAGGAATTKSATATTKIAATTTTKAAATAKSGMPAMDKMPVVDINSASKDDLAKLPGIGAAYAAKIVGGRPYANKTQLLSSKILPQSTYDKVSSCLIAKQAVAKAKGAAKK